MAPVVVVCGVGEVERAVAMRVARDGATVVVAAGDAAAAGAIVAAVTEAGGRGAYFALASGDDADALAELVAELFGR